MTESGQITASLTIAFGTSDGDSSANGTLTIELDSRADGYNKGKSSFTPGEYAYFLVYASDGLSVTVAASAGQVSFVGEVNIEKTEDVTFAGSETTTLTCPASSITSSEWMGTSLGSISLGSDKVTLTASGGGAGKVGMATITYKALAKVYGLGSPSTVGGSDSFSIALLATGV